MIRNRNPEMLKMERQTSFIFKLAAVIIGFTLVAIVTWYILFGIVAVHVIDKVQDDGLKGVIEDIWEGPDAKQGE